MPVIEECREGLPTATLLKHVVDRLGHLVVSGQFRALVLQPVVEAVHQGTGQVLAGDEPGISIQPIDLALDVEDGIDPFYASSATGEI